MPTEVSIYVAFPGGVRLDASIFDDRSYVEIDDAWLQRAVEKIEQQQDLAAPDRITARSDEPRAQKNHEHRQGKNQSRQSGF